MMKRLSLFSDFAQTYLRSGITRWDTSGGLPVSEDHPDYSEFYRV